MTKEGLGSHKVKANGKRSKLDIVLFRAEDEAFI